MALGGICVTGSLWQTYYICLTLTINTFTYLSFKGTNISLGSLLKLRIQRITHFFFWLGSLHNANAKTSLIFCQCIYWMWRCCLIFSFLYLNKKKTTTRRSFAFIFNQAAQRFSAIITVSRWRPPGLISPIQYLTKCEFPSSGNLAVSSGVVLWWLVLAAHCLRWGLHGLDLFW